MTTDRARLVGAFTGRVVDRAFVYLLLFMLQIAVFFAFELRGVIAFAVLLAVGDAVVSRQGAPSPDSPPMPAVEASSQGPQGRPPAGVDGDPTGGHRP